MVLQRALNAPMNRIYPPDGKCLLGGIIIHFYLETVTCYSLYRKLYGYVFDRVLGLDAKLIGFVWIHQGKTGCLNRSFGKVTCHFAL